MTVSIEVPEDVSFGYVTDHVLLAVGDGDDADDYPDAIAAEGSVTFTPVNPNVAVHGGDATIAIQPITATVRESDGRLTYNGKAGVWLVVGDYKVRWALKGAKITDATIRVTADHTPENPLILARQVEIKPTPSMKLVVNEQLYLETLGLIDRAEQIAKDASTAVGQGVDTAVERIAQTLEPYPLRADSNGDGTMTISGWASASLGDGTAMIFAPPPTPAPPGDWWSTNELALAQRRPITSLDVVHGRLYSGFGDWNANGDRVGVVSHDLATGEARVEHFPIESEAIEKVVAGADGSLYVPHIDGNKNYWAGCGYASRERVNGDWRWSETILPGQAIHVFDMVETDEGLWACGSSIPTDQSGGTSALWFRPNGGEWVVRYKGVEDHGTKGNSSRFYYLATDGHSVRVQDRSLSVDGLELTASSLTRMPRIPNTQRHAFVGDEWVTVSDRDKVIDGEVMAPPQGVSTTAWTVHNGITYYAAGQGGIERIMP